MQDDGARSRCELPVRRRSFLGATATLGAIGGLGVGTGGVGATRADDWEDEADDRIQEHRTVDFEVLVTDADGAEVDGAEVDVEMRDHEFGFGVAVDAELLMETDGGDEYREYVLELFNTAVLENSHKWSFFEANPDRADEATEWILDRGLDVRGHACLWGSVDNGAVPSDVVDALGTEGDGTSGSESDPEHVRERSFDHLEEIIEHYGDDVEHWDVVNEVLHEPSLIETIDGEDVDPVEAPVLAEWYREADDLAGEHGVGVDVNDYNVLVGPYEYARVDYQRQIEFLLEEGVDLDGIGLQCHFSEDEALEPDEIVAGLDLYAEYGADLRITEFDTADDEWDDEAKGEFLHTFLKCVFSHPNTADFIMWGFWDGSHWLGEAPLFYEDWEEKPAYEAYTDLVFEEWWTETSGVTDGGRLETNGFKGEYEITARYDGVEETTTATLVDDGESVELQLDTDTGTPDAGNGGTDDESDGTTDGDETDDTIPGLGVVSALAGLSGLAGYALLRDDDDL